MGATIKNIFIVVILWLIFTQMRVNNLKNIICVSDEAPEPVMEVTIELDPESMEGDLLVPDVMLQASSQQHNRLHYLPARTNTQRSPAEFVEQFRHQFGSSPLQETDASCDDLEQLVPDIERCCRPVRTVLCPHSMELGFEAELESDCFCAVCSDLQ